ncbi:MAG: hypothetical protein ACFFD4_02280 [Candidatus Odinarchaeota archaeon]
MREFTHRFMTGRVARDYEIMTLMGARTLQEAFDALISFQNGYERMLKEYNPMMEELYRKKWIFKNQVNKARKIISIISPEPVQ